MTAMDLKKNLPTFVGMWEKRQKARRNQLPRHLRPPEMWPLWLNLGIAITLVLVLFSLITHKEDYFTDWGPGLAIVACFPFLVFSIISSARYFVRRRETRGARLAKINVWITGFAFLMWAFTIAEFLS